MSNQELSDLIELSARGQDRAIRVLGSHLQRLNRAEILQLLKETSQVTQDPLSKVVITFAGGVIEELYRELRSAREGMEFFQEAYRKERRLD